jgi:hypothetical protein
MRTGHYRRPGVAAFEGTLTPGPNAAGSTREREGSFGTSDGIGDGLKRPPLQLAAEQRESIGLKRVLATEQRTD